MNKEQFLKYIVGEVEKKGCIPSAAQMGRELGTTRENIRQKLMKLKKAGYIKKTGRGEYKLYYDQKLFSRDDLLKELKKLNSNIEDVYTAVQKIKKQIK